MDIKVPAGITRLFKSNLDWNLYSDDQKALNDRKVQPHALPRPASGPFACELWCTHDCGMQLSGSQLFCDTLVSRP